MTLNILLSSKFNPGWEKVMGRSTPLLVLFLMAATFPAQIQGQESPPAKATADSVNHTANVFFPVLGYTPDTNLLGGVTWLRFFQLGGPDDDSRPSVFSPVAIVTTQKQFVLILGSELYWGNGKNHALITPQYLRFPDKFFGIGRDTQESDEEDYTPEQFAVDLLYERKFHHELAAGLTYHYDNHRLLETDEGGMLNSGTVSGTEKTTLSAPGLRLSWDSRDFTMSARTGSFLQAQVNFFRPDLGSDLHFTEYIVDLRRYWSLGSKGSLAALVMGKAQDGEPPFFVLPRLGGFEGLRGYLSGRYPDQALLLARTEWRSKEFWMGLGCVVFAGLGDVAASVDKLTTSAQLYTLGLGLRYTVNEQEQVKIRMDVGFGNGDSGFYLSLGEAF